MNTQYDWQNLLYNGLVTKNGKTPKIASINITKPNHKDQLSERLPAMPEVIGSNQANHGLHKNSKQRFSIHRSINFMPQES